MSEEFVDAVNRLRKEVGFHLIDEAEDRYTPRDEDIQNYRDRANQLLDEYNLSMYQLEEADDLRDVYERLNGVDTVLHAFGDDLDAVRDAHRQSREQAVEQEQYRERYEDAPRWKQLFMRKPGKNISPAMAGVAALGLGLSAAAGCLTDEEGEEDHMEEAAERAGYDSMEDLREEVDDPRAAFHAGNNSTIPGTVDQYTTLQLNASETEGVPIWRVYEPSHITGPVDGHELIEKPGVENWALNLTHAGPYIIQLIASNGTAEDTVTKNVTVNPLPVETRILPSQDWTRFVTGDEIRLEAEAASPHGEIVEYNWEIFFEDIHEEQGEQENWWRNTSAASVTLPLSSVGRINVSLEAVDEHGFTGEFSRSSYVYPQNYSEEEPAMVRGEDYIPHLVVKTGRGLNEETLIDYTQIGENSEDCVITPGASQFQLQAWFTDPDTGERLDMGGSVMDIGVWSSTPEFEEPVLQWDAEDQAYKSAVHGYPDGREVKRIVAGYLLETDGTVAEPWYEHGEHIRDTWDLTERIICEEDETTP